VPQLRKDPIIDRWVIIAADRARRPYDFEATPHRPPDRFCPFCQGNEQATPHEIAAYRDPDTRADEPGWRVRVVANKFPALQSDGQPSRQEDDLFTTAEGVGAHEVIIESPRHIASITELSGDEFRDVLGIYLDRLLDLKQDARLVHALIFKNVGAAAGASLEHIHSQLIAIPVVPTVAREEMAGSLDFFSRTGSCVYCEMIRRELAEGGRIVAVQGDFVAFCPFASRFPYETWVLPKSHSSHFEDLPRDQLADLSTITQSVVARLENVLDRPAYNYVIHSAPFDMRSLAHYHWHIEVMPSVTKAAGFEWGTGFHINPVSPEEAAAQLRQAAKSPDRSKHISTRGTG